MSKLSHDLTRNHIIIGCKLSDTRWFNEYIVYREKVKWRSSVHHHHHT